MKTLMLLAMGLLPAFALGQTVAEFDVSENRNRTMPATNVADGVAVTDMVSVGVDVLEKRQGTYCAADWSAARKRDPGKFYEFSVTPGQGGTVAYDSLAFSLFRGRGGQDAHGAQQWSLYASLDGFADPAAAVHLADMDISGSDGDEMVYFSIDVGKLGTQRGTVTFRLYGYDHAGRGAYSGFGDTTEHGLRGQGSSVLLFGAIAGRTRGTGDSSAPSPDLFAWHSPGPPIDGGVSGGGSSTPAAPDTGLGSDDSSLPSLPETIFGAPLTYLAPMSVPEPGLTGLLCLGGVGLVLRQRRRRNANPLRL